MNDETNEAGSILGSLFGVMVVVSCVLVCTEHAEEVFAAWTWVVMAAAAVYVIALPLKILMSGIEALSDAFNGKG